jgi:hypothetical protein
MSSRCDSGGREELVMARVGHRASETEGPPTDLHPHIELLTIGRT